MATQGRSQGVNTTFADEVVAMAKIGSCSSPSFIANGSEIFFLSNISGLPQIWKMPAAGGWPIQLTSFNDPVTSMAASPKGDLIAFELAPGGGLNTQIYLMNKDGLNVRRITSGGTVNNALGIWSNDGSILTYSSNQLNPDGLDCFLYDIQKSESKIICENKGTGSSADISDDNNLFLITRLKSRGSNDVYLVDRKNNTETLLTEHVGPGTFFGNFGQMNEVLLASNKDSDLIRFGRLKDKEFKVLASRGSEELVDFVVSHSKSKVVLVWSDAGRNKVSVFDLKAGKEIALPEFPVEIVQSITFSPDDSQMAFTGNGSTEPGNIWLYHFNDKKFTKLTESPHAGVDLKTLVKPELVRFKSFDGIELNGWLYKPKGSTAPYPTVMSFHGGPEGQSVPNFNSVAQLMVKNGIAFFLPNVRGSTGFGKNYVNLDNGALRVNGVKDIKACYEYLVAIGISKPRSVGIMGGSYGGYMVMAGVTEYPDMFAAGANLFGVVNFETFFANTEPWMAAISTVEYGDPKTQASLLRSLSPIHNISKVKTPLIVLHGANDTNVPVVEAQQVVDGLKINNIPVKYILFPDEGHGWRKTNNRVTSTVEIINWFANYLK